jgi:S-adenosylmethionine:tRNA ribosyltransferase-isomerase
MKVSAFDFELPPGLIADRPAEPRDAARLLVVAGSLNDRHVLDLPDLLQPGDLIVFNDTKVIPARLAGRRGEASVEVTLHQPVDSDAWSACWRVFAKPGKRLRVGDTVEFAGSLTAKVEDKLEGGEIVLAFDRAGGALRQALDEIGSMPLPPYIKRKATESDRQSYQTIFAAKEGAVAAPTAGLHITPRLLGLLKKRGVTWTTVTLHVGAGTFLPVKVEDTEEHRMHAEYGSISPETAQAINQARAAGGRIVACGTTSLRVLESAATETGKILPFDAETRIFITPGYRFRAVDLLLTNFHLPRSTLFMLVSAFAGLERMKSAYAHAMASGYRFYSYGDASLLHRSPA